MKDQLFMLGQYLLPHQTVSRLAGWFADNRSLWIKNSLINWFIKRYAVDLSESVGSTCHDFASFNEFFTRALEPGSRPLEGGEDAIVSPADGVISQIGKINHGAILQAKGHDFRLRDLLAGDESLERLFEDGQFVTVYLSPRDYHRVHMPLTGSLRQMIHVPGKLFSVNPLTVSRVPKLFARNERVICLFDTAYGPMCVIMVGAMIVSSIRTQWAGLITSPGRQITSRAYASESAEIRLLKGAELGSFDLGSTVIVLFGAAAPKWQNHCAHGAIKVGQLFVRTTP